MSIRIRSAIGTVLLCAAGIVGVFAPFVDPSFLWYAGAAAIAGLALIAWAFRSAVREVRSIRLKHESMLRAELENKGPDAPPTS